nr:TetR/AcrR family transcriptional regulator [Nocardia bovistercoris]
MLDAAWEELTEYGYHRMTMAGVAERAGAAKSVLYRRWPDKSALVRTLVEARVPRLGDPPVTGDLRADVVSALEILRAAYRGLAVLADADPALCSRLRHEADVDAVARIVRALMAVGVNPEPIGSRILRVPIDLVVRDVLDGGESAPGEIVDEVFLPLVRLRTESRPEATAGGK